MASVFRYCQTSTKYRKDTCFECSSYVVHIMWVTLTTVFVSPIKQKQYSKHPSHISRKQTCLPFSYFHSYGGYLQWIRQYHLWCWMIICSCSFWYPTYYDLPGVSVVPLLIVITFCDYRLSLLTLWILETTGYTFLQHWYGNVQMWTKGPAYSTLVWSFIGKYCLIKTKT